MWEFNWGVFWAVLVAGLPIGLFLAWMIGDYGDTSIRCLREMGSTLNDIRRQGRG